MRVSDNNPTRVGDLLNNFLEDRGLEKQISRTAAIEIWKEVVGENIAEVTLAKSVVASTLFVEVKSSAWLMELNLMKESLLARVNEKLDKDGAIERIILTLMNEKR
jgi:predicted nucleic acid-binding Zn ribbon protein